MKNEKAMLGAVWGNLRSAFAAETGIIRGKMPCLGFSWGVRVHLTKMVRAKVLRQNWLWCRDRRAVSLVSEERGPGQGWRGRQMSDHGRCYRTWWAVWNLFWELWKYLESCSRGVVCSDLHLKKIPLAATWGVNYWTYMQVKWNSWGQRWW